MTAALERSSGAAGPSTCPPHLHNSASASTLIEEDINTHHFVIVERHTVPMRDGVRLATDVYRPALSATLPDCAQCAVLLHRTPYDSSKAPRTEQVLLPDGMLSEAIDNIETAERFARRGYVVVMQDCRGRYKSEGRFTKYINEGDDGLDTLQWIRTQPWCNGKIGCFGLSYCAHVQVSLACHGPVGLSCLFLESGGFWDAFSDGVRQGGAFTMKQVTWAFKNAKVSPEVAANPEVKRALLETDLHAWFRNTSAWREGYSPLSLAPDYERYIFEDWKNDTFSPLWKRCGLYAKGFLHQFADVPVMIICSWYDPYIGSMTDMYCSLSACKHGPIQMVLGPWTHGDHGLTYAGDVDFGPQATFDRNVAPTFHAARLQWFEEHLHGRLGGCSPPSAMSPLLGFSPNGSPRATWVASGGFGSSMMLTDLVDMSSSAGGGSSSEAETTGNGSVAGAKAVAGKGGVLGGPEGAGGLSVGLGTEGDSVLAGNFLGLRIPDDDAAAAMVGGDGASGRGELRRAGSPVSVGDFPGGGEASSSPGAATRDSGATAAAATGAAAVPAAAADGSSSVAKAIGGIIPPCERGARGGGVSGGSSDRSCSSSGCAADCVCCQALAEAAAVIAVRSETEEEEEDSLASGLATRPSQAQGGAAAAASSAVAASRGPAPVEAAMALGVKAGAQGQPALLVQQAEGAVARAEQRKGGAFSEATLAAAAAASSSSLLVRACSQAALQQAAVSGAEGAAGRANGDGFGGFGAFERQLPEGLASSLVSASSPLALSSPFPLPSVRTAVAAANAAPASLSASPALVAAAGANTPVNRGTPTSVNDTPLQVDAPVPVMASVKTTTSNAHPPSATSSAPATPSASPPMPGPLPKLPFLGDGTGRKLYPYQMSRVLYFRMGGGTGRRNAAGRLDHGGQWLNTQDWPMPFQAKPKPLYLAPDHKLSRTAPEQLQGSFSYVHDPASPVPTIGGNVTSGEPIMVGGAYDQVERPDFFGCQQPGRRLSDRPDVLSFSTPPLDADTEVTGAVKVVLHFSSSCPDTDFCATLVDVYPPSEDYPEGFSLNLANGIRRARFRDASTDQGLQAPSYLVPGSVYCLTIELNVTSNLFKKGHQIRVDIASSNFPRYDLNFGLGPGEQLPLQQPQQQPCAGSEQQQQQQQQGPNPSCSSHQGLSCPAPGPPTVPLRCATNTIFAHAGRASHVLLPMRKAPGAGEAGATPTEPLIPFSSKWRQRRPTWSR